MLNNRNLKIGMGHESMNHLNIYISDSQTVVRELLLVVGGGISFYVKNISKFEYY